VTDVTKNDDSETVNSPSTTATLSLRTRYRDVSTRRKLLSALVAFIEASDVYAIWVLMHGERVTGHVAYVYMPMGRSIRTSRTGVLVCNALCRRPVTQACVGWLGRLTTTLPCVTHRAHTKLATPLVTEHRRALSEDFM